MSRLDIKTLSTAAVEDLDIMSYPPPSRRRVITAALVAYESIASLDDGLYVWADPDATSVAALTKWLRDAPFKVKDCTELHTTVMFAPGIIPKHIDDPTERDYTRILARLKKVETWVDHKDRTLLVVELDSPELQDIHAKLVAQGISHSYPDYEPHITIAKDIILTPDVYDWLARTNASLAEEPFEIIFEPPKAATCS